MQGGMGFGERRLRRCLLMDLNISFKFPKAIKKAKLTQIVSTIKLRCSDLNSAINPSITGPTRKPMFVVAAINETPSAVFTPSTFEASRYTSGTITEKPRPIIKSREL